MTDYDYENYGPGYDEDWFPEDEYTPGYDDALLQDTYPENVIEDPWETYTQKS